MQQSRGPGQPLSGVVPNNGCDLIQIENLFSIEQGADFSSLMSGRGLRCIHTSSVGTRIPV